jgi:hypothetical protein
MNYYGYEGEMNLEVEVEVEMVLEAEVVDWPMALSYFFALLPIYCYPIWVLPHSSLNPPFYLY